MPKPLLRTKLYIPSPQPGLVHRHRLSQQIDNGLNRKLTLISAPAGFGKTTLLSEWILTHQHNTSWLALEEADNDSRWRGCARGQLTELRADDLRFTPQEAIAFLNEIEKLNLSWVTARSSGAR